MVSEYINDKLESRYDARTEYGTIVDKVSYIFNLMSRYAI